jgi:hypothetical protein
VHPEMPWMWAVFGAGRDRGNECSFGVETVKKFLADLNGKTLWNN